jgi:hypothetical protein
VRGASDASAASTTNTRLCFGYSAQITIETLKLGNQLAMVVIAIWHEFGQSSATHVSNARSYYLHDDEHMSLCIS